MNPKSTALLQAKAAIGTGIEQRRNQPRLSGRRIRHACRCFDTIAIGLRPGYQTVQVRVVGSTSLAGALLALLDRPALVKTVSLRGRIEVIGLSRFFVNVRKMALS